MGGKGGREGGKFATAVKTYIGNKPVAVPFTAVRVTTTTANFVLFVSNLEP